MESSVFPPLLVYVIVAIIVFFVSTRIIHAGPTHIFALIVLIGIIYKLEKDRLEESLTSNEELDYRSEKIGNPEYFYRDPNFINLFYDILKWKNLNPTNYNNAVKSIDNVLRIEHDTEIGVANCIANYNIANEQAGIAINMIHGFTYVLDHPILLSKLKNVLQRLRELLERHIRLIREYCNKTDTVKSIEDPNGPFGYDELTVNDQFSYYYQ